MEKIERYVGDEELSKLEIMNFNAPIQRGEISDLDKFETLLHYLLYDKMKVVPEEISVLITESHAASTENKKNYQKYYLKHLMFRKYILKIV